MISSEIKIFSPISPVTGLLNGSFNLYTTGWTGDDYTTTDAIYPTLTPIEGQANQLQSIDNPSGWTWSNGFMTSNPGSPLTLYQKIGGIVTGFTYQVKFLISGYDNMIAGQTLQVALYGNTGNTLVTDDGYYSMDIYISTLDSNTNAYGHAIRFIPTLGFTGGITSITINSLNKTSESLDLYDEDSFNLTFQIQTNISDKAATYSKTIKIPGTGKNNLIFDNLMDIGRYISQDQVLNDSTQFFNKKITAGIYADSVELLTGFLEVQNIISINNSIEYECIFYSNMRTIADSIGEKLCAGNEDINDDLNSFADYNHLHNMSTITSTWNIQSQEYTGSTGVFYPMIDWAGVSTGNKFRMENFKPTLYVKEIWDKIFEKAGFTYTSQFLTGITFGSLVIPIGNTLEESSLYFENQKFRVGASGYNLSNQSWKDNDFRRVVYDLDSGGTMFNGANGEVPYSIANNYWSPTQVGIYNLSTKVYYNVHFEPADSFVPVQDWNIVRIKLQLIRGRWKIQNKINYLVEEILKETIVEHTLDYVTYSPIPLVGCDLFLNPQEIEVSYSNSNCLIGDLYYVKIQLDQSDFKVASNGGNLPIFKDIYIYPTDSTNNTYFINEPSNNRNYYLDGEQVFGRDILPRKMKQIDFIKSIANKFNLMFSEDKTKLNNLMIEPYDNFYFTNSGNTIDWTFKVDRSKNISFERIPQLIDKDVEISFADDSADFLINEYKDKNNYNFGDKLLKNSYYSTETENIEDSFSSALLGQYGDTNYIVSKIYAENENDIKIPSDCDYNYKVLYRGMLSVTDIGTNLDQVLITTYNSILGDALTGNTSEKIVATLPTKIGYPYSGFLDNPYNPTLDINYGQAKYYLHPGGKLTPNNLTWLYWNKKLALYFDVNSKQLTCYVKLNYSDISMLDFRKPIYIDGHLYRLQRIVEWTNTQSCKVELIQIQALNETSYATSQNWKSAMTSIPGGGTTKKGETTGAGKTKSNVVNLTPQEPMTSLSITGTTETDFSGITLQDYNNTYKNSGVGMVAGSQNIINSSQMLVIGDGNYVQDSENIAIFSDNITINSGITDVYVFGILNTGNTSILESNVIYGNNLILTGLTTIYTGDTSDFNMVAVNLDGRLYSITGTTGGVSGSSGTSGKDGETYGTSGTSGIGISGTSGSSGSSGSSPDYLIAEPYYDLDIFTLFVPELVVSGLTTEYIGPLEGYKSVLCDPIGKLVSTTSSPSTSSLSPSILKGISIGF